ADRPVLPGAAPASPPTVASRGATKNVYVTSHATTSTAPTRGSPILTRTLRRTRAGAAGTLRATRRGTTRRADPVPSAGGTRRDARRAGVVPPAGGRSGGCPGPAAGAATPGRPPAARGGAVHGGAAQGGGAHDCAVAPAARAPPVASTPGPTRRSRPP